MKGAEQGSQQSRMTLTAKGIVILNLDLVGTCGDEGRTFGRAPPSPNPLAISGMESTHF